MAQRLVGIVQMLVDSHHIENVRLAFERQYSGIGESLRRRKICPVAGAQRHRQATRRSVVHQVVMARRLPNEAMVIVSAGASFSGQNSAQNL